MNTSNFSPVPSRVMDGSEPGETTPAAVLSGAPIELQARTVRQITRVRPNSILNSTRYLPISLLTLIQNLPTSQTGNPIRQLDPAQLAHGLGPAGQRSQVGEPANGLAIERRLHARHTPQLQVE